MALEAPRLDDRQFDDLVAEARARIPLYTKEWTDHNLSDPGITLIELFAWMMDIVLYRLNRVPDKHFIKFMELIGMRLHEAEPARGMVTMWLTAPQGSTLTIPADTQVATVRTENEAAIVFSTDGPMDIVVPKLAYALTSYGDEDTRTYLPLSPEEIQEGTTSFPIFASSTPANNDTFYLGFENNISNHILGVNLDVNLAQGAGINPRNPPYIWEVVPIGKDKWEAVDLDLDDTGGLNQSGLIRLHVPELARSERNGQQAYWVRCRYDYTKAEERYDVSPQINRVQVNSWGATISATNVTRMRREVLGRSDGTPGQRFYLEHKPLIARSSDEYILVRRDEGQGLTREERWQEVTDFANSAATDRHYMIDSDTGEVRFGPALPQQDGTILRYGALPPQGAMVMMTGYRFGGGREGNVAANTLTVMKTALPYIARVTNRFPAAGGKDAENLENAKTRVPGHLRSLGRAVTAADFEYLAREAAPGEVGRVVCLQDSASRQGEVNVLVIPSVPNLAGYLVPESLELPNALRQKIQAYLDDRRLLSTRLDVTQPAYQWVKTEVRLRVAPYHDSKKVLDAVRDRLIEFIDPLRGGMDGKGWPFGRDLVVADVMAAVQTVPGVNFVRSVRLFEIDRRQFTQGAETIEIRLPPQGVVVSYDHTIIAD